MSVIELPSPFDQFWAKYPRRVAKKDARVAWLKLTPAQQEKALEAVVAWMPQWAKQEVQFIPHPATWLNGERFEDELPREVRVSAAAHVLAKLPEVDQHTQMPETAREALSKFRLKSI